MVVTFIIAGCACCPSSLPRCFRPIPACSMLAAAMALSPGSSWTSGRTSRYVELTFLSALKHIFQYSPSMAKRSPKVTRALTRCCLWTCCITRAIPKSCSAKLPEWHVSVSSLRTTTATAFWPGRRLRFMDWVGNARHGVVLPYNYWPARRWTETFASLGLVPVSMKTRLRLYPWPATWVFERKLHFLAKLEKKSVPHVI